MRDFHKGVWQMSLAMLISGSIGAFVLLSGLPVTEVVFWRCLIGAVALFIFIRMSRKPFSPLTRTTLLLAILGGAALVVNWLLLFAAYERISIGLSTVVYNTQPFMLVLMGMLFGERVSLVKWGWLVLAFGGVVILLSSELTSAHGADWLAGIGLAMAAAFFYAVTAIIARKLRSVAPQHIAFIQVLTGVVMLLPFARMPSLSADFPWPILEKALREANRPQGPLLSRQLFPLHQAIQGDKTPGDVRIVNAVIKLRHDTEQMAKHARVVLHRLRRHKGLLAHAVTQGGKRIQALQRAADAFTNGTSRNGGLFVENAIQGRQVFIHQRPAGFAFRGVKLPL